MAFVSPNGLWLTRNAAGAPPSLRSDGILEAVASGALTLTSKMSQVVLGASGNVDALVVGPDSVTVNADLLVADRIVVVSAFAGSNDAVPTDGSGILVADPRSDGGRDERSFRWRAGASPSFHGVDASGVGGASNAGGWEVRGGYLAVAASVPAGRGGPANGLTTVDREVAYGLRVNELDELEVFKRMLPTSCNGVGATYRSVVKFGGVARIPGANAITLPKSANRFI